MNIKFEGGGGKALVAGPLKKTELFFAASLSYYTKWVNIIPNDKKQHIKSGGFTVIRILRI